jgi:hypothetical protein
MVHRKSRPSLTQTDRRGRKEQILQTLVLTLQRPLPQKIAKKTPENISRMEAAKTLSLTA